MTDSPPLARDPAGCRLSVWVVPGARRPGIVGMHGGRLKVRVAAPAERGRANTELLAVLPAEFDCRADIVDGHSRRAKTVLLRGVTVEAASKRLPV